MKRNIRLAVIIIFLFLLVYFLYLVRASLYPFIIALFLAYVLNPAVCYIEIKGLPRLWAIIVMYSVVFSAIILVSNHIFPILLRDLESLGKQLPQIAAKVEELLFVFQSKYQSSALPNSMRTAIDDNIVAIEQQVQAFAASLTNAVVDIIGRGVGLAITPVLAFYLLYDSEAIKEKILLLFPRRWHGEMVLICTDIDKVLGGMIRGQLLVATIVGFLVSLGLYFLNVPFAILIGILAGLFDFIPYFGAFIGAVPAITLALLESPWLAGKVVLLFLVVHQLESVVISPKIIGENTGLHPLSVIFFVFAGGEMFGIAGMLLGVPVAAVGKVFLQHFFKLLL